MAIGVALQVRGDGLVVVQLEGGARVVSHLAGRLVVRAERVSVGDVLEVEPLPHDPTRGRIVGRSPADPLPDIA